MKKKFLVMFLVTIYLIQPLGSKYTPLSASKYFLIALFLLSFVLIIINIVTAFLGLRRSSSNMKKNSLGVIMGFKLVLIPFFVSNAFWFLFMMGYTLWFVIPFLFLLYAYIVLLTTSSYLIVQIIKMGKSGALTKGQCALHIIMQLLFFTDVIDSVYLFFKYRKHI